MRVHLSFMLVLLIILALVLPVGAQSEEDDLVLPGADQVRILASDGVSGDRFGAAVALAGDLLVVGAPEASSSAVERQGAVYIFVRDAEEPTGWREQAKLSPSVASSTMGFGTNVVITGDLVVVAAPRADTNAVGQSGAVFLFGRDSAAPGGWRELRRLSEPVGTFGQFGSALAFENGLLAVGAAGANTVYLYDGTNDWAPLGTLSVTSASNDAFGAAIAIAGDRIVVGAPLADVSGANSNDGAAFVFERDGPAVTTWSMAERVAIATPGGSASRTDFGYAVALDGDRLLVGARFADTNGATRITSVGAAYLFEHEGATTENASTWRLLTRLDSSRGAAFDYFGSAVALSGDLALVGSPNDSTGFRGEGLVYRYEGADGAWAAETPLDAVALGPDEGLGTALTLDGTTTAVGAPGAANRRGAVYLFTPPTLSTAPFAVYLPLVAREVTPPTGTLSDGATLTLPTGPVVGTVAGTLDAPLPLWITQTRAPADAPPGLVTAGPFYQIHASRTVNTPFDKPFVVGLPVPSGVDPGKLAVVARVSAEQNLHGDEPDWLSLPGSYDAANGLFVFTLGTLREQPSLVALFSHPANQPIPAPAADAAPAQSSPTFSVTCDPLTAAACSDGHRQWMTSAVGAAYTDFVTVHGFREPALTRYSGSFSVGALQAILGLSDTYYGLTIRIAPCPYGGQYNPDARSLWVCLPETGELGEQEQRLVRHEFFHAIQFAYPAIVRDNETRNSISQWTIEGTAAAAEHSSSTMRRSPNFELRQISRRLVDTSGDYEYRAQDFWVYTGLRLGEPLSYLKTVLERGATPTRVNDVLNLSDTYWNWVKNQLIEKEETFEGAFDAPPCVLELGLIGPSLTARYPYEVPPLGRLLPLQSIVVEFEFAEEVFDAWVHADNDGNDEDLRYKVYRYSEEGCTLIPDGERTFTSLPLGAELFVLVSNVSRTNSFQFIVEVDSGAIDR